MKNITLLIALIIVIVCNGNCANNKTLAQKRIYTLENLTEDQFSVKDFDLIKDFILANGSEFSFNTTQKEKSIKIESVILEKTFYYKKFDNNTERIDVELVENTKGLHAYTIERTQNKIIVFHTNSRFVLEKDVEIMNSDFEELIIFLKNYSIYFDTEKDVELIIEGDYTKHNEGIYLGNEPMYNWIFYDKEHPYSLLIQPASLKEEDFYTGESENRTLLKEYQIDEVLIQSIKEDKITQQCPSISYIIYTEKWNYVIQYPDCGLKDDFRITAKEYVDNFVLNNFTTKE